MNNHRESYRLTYPEKNAVWMSTVPDKCTVERKKECCQRMLYTPSIANRCSSTFMPWDRPNPYQCLKLCKGIDVFGINGCQAEILTDPPRRVNNNGCIMEPSVAEYTNISFIKPKNGCGISTSILTDPNRYPPNPPQYGMKYSSAYNPIEYVYGKPYTY